MSIDPSSGVMNPKAVLAAQASANELKAFIAKSRGEMRRVTSNLAAETSLGSLRRRALEAIRAEKIKEVSDLAARIPSLAAAGSSLDFDSFAPHLYTGPVLTQDGAGWSLNPILETAFEEAWVAVSKDLEIAASKKAFKRRPLSLDPPNNCVSSLGSA